MWINATFPGDTNTAGVKRNWYWYEYKIGGDNTAVYITHINRGRPAKKGLNKYANILYYIRGRRLRSRPGMLTFRRNLAAIYSIPVLANHFCSVSKMGIVGEISHVIRIGTPNPVTPEPRRTSHSINSHSAEMENRCFRARSDSNGRRRRVAKRRARKRKTFWRLLSFFRSRRRVHNRSDIEWK